MNIQVKALFIDTFKKEIRNKTLIFALIFSTLSIFIGYSLSKLFFQGAGAGATNEMTTSIIVNGMFGFLNFWSVIISVYFGVSAVRSDFQSNIIYQYLSFPISRTKYFFVRLLGTWSIVFGFYLYSYVLTFILFMGLSKSFSPTFGQIKSILLMAPYTLIYVLLTFIISLFLSRIGAFITMIFISGLITISDSIYMNVHMTEYFKDFSLFKLLALIIFTCLPRLGNLSEISGSMMRGTPLELNLPLEFLHLILTSVIVAYIARIIINKKDF
jgi:ABC-type transport system involved in multi-copper enzyme maturation permease subunit